MKDRFIPQKYELCSQFDKRDLVEICLGLSTAKDKHYISFAKNNRLKKKYIDRLLSRAEAYLQFVKEEAQKRGGYEFLFDNDIVLEFKKNRFISFSVEE